VFVPLKTILWEHPLFSSRCSAGELFQSSKIDLKMADHDALIRFINDTTTLRNSISLKMVEFLNGVKDQPAGFQDFGLDFLDICQMLNALQEILNEHFKSNQPLPEKAIPELAKVWVKTLDDFALRRTCYTSL
jgi:hypothetical protein